MTHYAFIPARGGSKSLPLKNIRLLNGKPLIYWVIKAASDCPLIDHVIVATEHPRIKEVALSFNLPKVQIFDRDPANAVDTSPTMDVVMEFIQKYKPHAQDWLFLLQATSPLTCKDDLANIFNGTITSQSLCALTCVREKRFFWKENNQPLNYDYNNRPRRQDFKGIWMENGAIYLSQIKNILRHQNLLHDPIHICEMPSYTAFELDEPTDWIIVEHLMKHCHQLSTPPPWGTGLTPLTSYPLIYEP